ncbi:MAG: SPOR domain-containing protein [Magnetococcales bacterium]|nr:SPOR domain-containing protein [Magnetococcales bacterium]
MSDHFQELGRVVTGQWTRPRVGIPAEVSTDGGIEVGLTRGLMVVISLVFLALIARWTGLNAPLIEKINHLLQRDSAVRVVMPAHLRAQEPLQLAPQPVQPTVTIHHKAPEPLPPTERVSQTFPEITGGPYMVLAGSFTDAGIAEKILTRLQTSEIPAHMREVRMADRDFIHLLVGPFDQEESARTAVQMIRERSGILAEFILTTDDWSQQQSGLDLASTQPVVEEPAPPPPVGEFQVSAGAFLDTVNADKVRDRLVLEGIMVQLSEAQIGDQHYIQLVGGPFMEYAEAESMVKEIQDRTGILAEITTVQPAVMPE